MKKQKQKKRKPAMRTPAEKEARRNTKKVADLISKQDSAKVLDGLDKLNKA